MTLVRTLENTLTYRHPFVLTSNVQERPRNDHVKEILHNVTDIVESLWEGKSSEWMETHPSSIRTSILFPQVLVIESLDKYPFRWNQGDLVVNSARVIRTRSRWTVRPYLLPVVIGYPKV